MNIKTQRHLSRLIFRYLRDRLNEEESRELERWRAASEAHELLFRRLLSSAHWQRSIGRFVKNESDTHIIRKSKFPQNPKRSVRFSGKGTKRSVQKRKARNTQKAETKVL